MVAAAVAARAGAFVTVAGQAVVAVLVCLLAVGGAAVQAHGERGCRGLPTAARCAEGS